MLCALLDAASLIVTIIDDVPTGAALLMLDAGTHLTHDLAAWKDEITWMSLYFSAAVWASLALCVFYSLDASHVLSH